MIDSFSRFKRRLRGPQSSSCGTTRGAASSALPLGQIVTQANRVFCESALAGQYATLVCGQAKPSGDVEIHNAGHWPAIIVGRSGVLRIESTGLPLGMFLEAEFSATWLQLEVGDTLFLYADGLTGARSAGDEHGVERVTRLVRQQAARPPAELISACLDELRAFVDGANA